ncbi:MAG TPA: hypothetical protein VIH99_02995 [Bdellovibrionota bacterium]|jgi:hypothetical protein
MKRLFFILAALSVGMGEAQACPSKPQNIKIIDLKSGWLRGDGMDTDAYVIRHITATCPGVKIYYEHQLEGQIVGPSDRTQSPGPDPATFDQIWLLSGGEADPADIRVESLEFKKYFDLIVQGNSNLFLGTGFGNVYHANAVTNGLGARSLFATERTVSHFPSPTKDDSIVSLTAPEESERSNPLFRGISTLPDVVKIGGFVAPNDRLVIGGWSPTRALAFDTTGQAVLGEAIVGGRKLILDANISRLYLVRKNEASILQYLENIATALER